MRTKRMYRDDNIPTGWMLIDPSESESHIRSPDFLLSSGESMGSWLVFQDGAPREDEIDTVIFKEAQGYSCVFMGVSSETVKTEYTSMIGYGNRLFTQELNSATNVVSDMTDIDGFLGEIFSHAVDEIFEDGIQTQFSNILEQFIKIRKSDSILSLSAMILNKRTNTEIASEALRVVGRIDDPSTHEIRRWLLEKALSSSSARIRDSAGLGIASINDPNSIPQLKKAIDKEQYPELRNDLQIILDELL